MAFVLGGYLPPWNFSTQPNPTDSNEFTVGWLGLLWLTWWIGNDRLFSLTYQTYSQTTKSEFLTGNTFRGSETHTGIHWEIYSPRVQLAALQRCLFYGTLVKHGPLGWVDVHHYHLTNHNEPQTHSIHIALDLWRLLTLFCVWERERRGFVTEPFVWYRILHLFHNVFGTFHFGRKGNYFFNKKNDTDIFCVRFLLPSDLSLLLYNNEMIYYLNILVHPVVCKL